MQGIYLSGFNYPSPVDTKTAVLSGKFSQRRGRILYIAHDSAHHGIRNPEGGLQQARNILKILQGNKCALQTKFSYKPSLAISLLINNITSNNHPTG
jgi:hypothetical protein